MKYILSLFIFFVCPSLYAGPAISIGSLYNYMDEGKTSLLKRVYNSGTSTAFVKVRIAEIIYNPDGTNTEMDELSSIKDTSDMEGLIASPAHLIVPAGGAGTSRLIYIGQRDKERYFRVRFVPVLPEKKDEFLISDAESEQYKKSLSAGVNVLTGYGSFLIVRPNEVKYDTKISDLPGKYQISNNGNSTVALDIFYECTENGNQCSEPAKHHILPGRQLILDKKNGHSYNFDLIEGSRSKPIILK